MPVGEVTIEANPAEAVFAVLAEGPRTLGQIFADPRVEATGGGNLAFQAIAILMAGGAILPAVGPGQEENRRESVTRFNRAMLMGLGSERQEHTLAASVVGTGMMVPPIDQMLLLRAADHEPPPIDTLVEEAAARNQTILRDGQPISSAEARAELEQTLAAFRRDRLPIYRQIGVI